MFFFSSRRRHTRFDCDWSSDVCSSDLAFETGARPRVQLVTMTGYDETFPFPIGFGPMVLSQIVAQVLSDHGKTMFRTAETEKYAHVTYFFNGGVETPYPGEERLLVPSQKVATYDLMPEMSAPGVTDVL